MAEQMEKAEQNEKSPGHDIVPSGDGSDAMASSNRERDTRSLTDRLSDVPVELMVSVGKTRISIAELVSMEPDRLFRLDTKVEDPVSLLVNGKLFAYGYLEEADDGGFQIRISALVENGAG